MTLLSRAKKLIAGKDKKATAKKAAQSSVAAAGGEAGSEKAGSVSGVLAARIGLVPLLTEKSFESQVTGGAAFRVKQSASKTEIARAVQEQYGTKVLGVRTSRVRGKIRRRGVVLGTTPAWKKAYVRVADIQKLHVNP